MARALVIAAHGSHYSPGTALPAWTCVDAIRQTGLFDEVTAAFWKEQPSFGTVLGGLRAQDVTVVPLFSSPGYFSGMVLPNELQARPDQRVSITPAVGTHPHFADLVARRISGVIRGYAAQQTTLVMVGHGTPRHNQSSSTTKFQADLLRGRFGEVLTAYLDEEPYISDVYAVARFSSLVIVPFFIAEGLHTQTDIPAALGLHEPLYEPQMVDGRQVIYTPPVALEPDLYQVVLALAGENPATALTGSPWDAFPQEGGEPAEQVVGQVWLGADYVCHMADRDAAPESLHLLESPAALRDFVRFDAGGVFRPLASARNLRQGWRVAACSDQRRAAIVETIYPALPGGSAPRRAASVIARQRGKYRLALSSEAEATTVRAVCAGCVKVPLWHRAAPGAALGCVEPCSIWLEALRHHQEALAVGE